MPKKIYNSIVCRNPDCPVGGFIPTNSKHVYCDPICKSQHHREMNKENELSIREESKEFRRMDKVIGIMHKNCLKNNIPFLTDDVFKAQDIPLTKAVSIKIESKTGFKINWIYSYGIMCIESGKYKIVKKLDYEK